VDEEATDTFKIRKLITQCIINSMTDFIQMFNYTQGGLTRIIGATTGYLKWEVRGVSLVNLETSDIRKIL